MDQSEHSMRTIFAEALEIPDARQRADFLSQACGTDSALRQEIEELLSAEATAAHSFLPNQPSRPDAQRLLSRAAEALEESRSTAPVACVSEKPGDRIGRYKLLEQIGEGGCGVVYMADQEEPVRRRVALKVIKLGMDTKQVVARFEAERQALALMDHAHIANVLDGGATDAGRPYFVMELVRGIKITDYCDENDLCTRERLELFVQVCQAVQHAHQKGIIHRDLKPSNILVTVNDGVPVPKVIDFGIAKATEGKLTDKTLFTSFDQFLGTPAYMSPEQTVFTSVDIDTRSDIYSLGVLLYELLTGKTPFDSKALLACGLDEMRRMIREKDPAPPSTRLRCLPQEELTTTARHRQSQGPKLIHTLRGDLDWVVIKCLQKDRSRRYETANSLVSDIKRHLNNEPVIARPPSRLYEFRKTVRRHKVGFAAGGAVIAVLAAGVLVSTLEAVRARRAEKEQGRLAVTARIAEQSARRESYSRAMLLGFEALRARDYGLVRELLAQTRSIVGEAKGTDTGQGVPAWEWRHLAWETRDESSRVLARCARTVESLAVSPDGNWLAAGTAAGHVLLWALSPKAPPVEWRIGSDAECLAFSPDSRKLAVGCVDGTVRTLANPAGEILAEFHEPARILDLRFSSDGRRLAFCTEETFSIANIQTQEREETVHQVQAWGAR
jgi:eukaryotic-like serine/threonine-protein kinase